MRWRDAGGYDRGDQRAADAAMVRNPAQMMGRLPCVHGMAWSDCDIIVFPRIRNAQGA